MADPRGRGGDPDDPGSPGPKRTPAPAPKKPTTPTPKKAPAPGAPGDGSTGKVTSAPGAFGLPPSAYESKDMGPGNTRPGFQLGDNLQEYDAWRSQFLDPHLAYAYGPSFIAFEWFAHKTNLDVDQYTDTLLSRGWTGIGVPGAGGFTSGGAGGGRGGGGGGGGGDPAQQIAAMEATIRNQARTIGLELDDASIHSLASVVVENNWSGDMLNDYLAGGVSSNPDNARAGSFTAAVDFVKATAASQLMPIAETSAREHAARMISGEMDEAGLRSMFQAMAAMKYAWAQPALTAGVTMRDLMTPSRDRVAQELEKPAESIDLMDAEWQGMMITTDDKGQTRMATDSEVVSRARRRGEYTDTRGAKQLGAEAVTLLRRAFEGGS